ncbi:hypothetical protein LOSG293_190060 [Secundilactobacillus oryzae JCM 18671]|uniref:PepSY domain-containing protein n=1 Tax=Secundilactobacillus oryzae JCM 18671 TaxID=1291743 RepID=A0A081BJ81_9LACO|nr:PepSY domain-containing protein [Secundilactobacillus oryzae]GAK48099.1 hypothetical protein LOSG293_190060 [Secundilactobacillus oryzae JCM 18671]
MKKPLIMMVTAVGLLLAGCSSNNQHPQDSSSQSSETSTASSSTKTKLQDAQDVSISLIQAVDKVNAEQENARLTSVELSNDAGGYVYEIETVTTNREFKYTVDAESGKLDETKNERLEADDRSESDAERFTLNNVRSVQKTVKTARQEGAKGNLREYSLSREDNGKLVYELKFDDGETVREIGIDATSGDVTQPLQTDD